MPYLSGQDDLQWYRETFGDVWQSATLTCSLVEAEGAHIPMGEFSISRTTSDERAETLYQEGAFSVRRVVSNDPFDLLERVLSGEVPTADQPVPIETDELSTHPQSYFVSDPSRRRLRNSRPDMEVNAVIKGDIPDKVEETYGNVVDQLDDQLRRASEPYYDVEQCERYYFDHIFWPRRKSPTILLFADSGVELGIDEAETLEVKAPTALFDEMFVSIIPRRPHGEHEGWRVALDGQVDPIDSGRSQYTENLDLEGINTVYAILYLRDRSVSTIKHEREEAASENPRYGIIQAFDQDDRVTQYLGGSDADRFEMAVLNAFSTAGWIVQWYGDDSFVVPNHSDDVPGAPYGEIDIIAYHPDDTTILFIECTNQDISNKEQILDRTEAIMSVVGDTWIPADHGLTTLRTAIPCIAVPQTPAELSDEVLEEFGEKGIEVLHSERIKEIYAASEGTDETVSIDPQRIDTV